MLLNHRALVLQEKEFTGPRYDKGWEPLLYRSVFQPVARVLSGVREHNWNVWKSQSFNIFYDEIYFKQPVTIILFKQICCSGPW
jgi:hypothetical protein